MEKRLKRYWFFDFDGTVCDTEADIKLAWKKSIADLGLDCPQFDSVYRTGPSINDISRELFPGRADIDELIERIRAAFAKNYDGCGFPNTVPYPGITDWMERLKAQGCKVYFATNKRMAGLAKIIEKFNWSWLDGYFTSDRDPMNVRKKPEFLGDALIEVGASADDAVMVGDTKGDIDAGKANGMHTIGVTWGYGSEEELLDADIVLHEVPKE